MKEKALYCNLVAGAMCAMLGASGLYLGIMRETKVNTSPTFGPFDAWLGLAFLVAGLGLVAINVLAEHE